MTSPAPTANTHQSQPTSPTTSTRGSRSQQNFKTMNKTINFTDEQKQALVERISDVLNETGAYSALYKLLVVREEVLLHTDMENLAEELEEFIFKWTQIEE